MIFAVEFQKTDIIFQLNFRLDVLSSNLFIYNVRYKNNFLLLNFYTNFAIVSSNNSLVNGFDKYSLHPASNAFFLSFSNAWAVIAIIGICENSFDAFKSFVNSNLFFAPLIYLSNCSIFVTAKIGYYS